MDSRTIFRNSAFVIFIYRDLYLLQLKQEQGILKYHPCGGKADGDETPLTTVNRERREDITFSRDFEITKDDYLCENKFEMNDIDTVWNQKFFFKTLNDADINSMQFGDVKKWVFISPDEIRNMTVQNASLALLGFIDKMNLRSSKHSVSLLSIARMR